MKAAIFDLDGTLLDSMHVWDDVDRIFLTRKGVALPPDLYDTIKSMSLRAACEYFQTEFKITGTIEELMEECNSIARNQYLHTIPAKPFVIDYLYRLKARGVKMCVATATEKDFALAALRRLGVCDLFQFILTDEDVGAGKIEPAIYLESARRMSEEVRDCVVFEDALHAIETAKGAGFTVWAVGDPSSERYKNSILSLCDRYVESYKDLL